MENLTTSTSAVAMLSADEKKAKWIKTARVFYWINTVFFGGSLLVAGIMYLTMTSSVAAYNQYLGYPVYFFTILGTFKTLGAIAILWGRFPVLKEWAYVGYSLNLIIAAASHVFVGSTIGSILTPLSLLVLVLISYRQWKTGWM